MANKQVYEWWKTPQDILQVLLTLEQSVSELEKIGHKDGLKRKFTLDGRLVGDVGELIVARHFRIVPNKKPEGHTHDLFAKIGKREYGVQVKLRRAAGNAKILFKSIPEILVVIYFKRDWSEWRMAYNGPGRILKHYPKGISPSQLDHETRKQSKASLRIQKLKT